MPMAHQSSGGNICHTVLEVKIVFLMQKNINYLGRTKLALNVDRRHIVKANLVLLFYWKKEDVNGYDKERAD